MNFEQREKQKLLAELDARLESNPLDALARAQYISLQDKRLYVVEFDSANYCGAPEHCLAWAHDEEDAMDEAAEFASEYYREQDQSQWEEENESEDPDGVTWASMRSAELLEGSEFANYVEDERQQQAYYQIVN